MEQLHAVELRRQNRLGIGTLFLFEEVVDDCGLFFGLYITFLCGMLQGEEIGVGLMKKFSGDPVCVKMFSCLKHGLIFLIVITGQPERTADLLISFQARGSAATDSELR